MLYLFMGLLTLCYFYKKFDVPVFAESKKTTILNLLVIIVMVLIWPVFAVLEIIQRIRGEK